jgi:hypothetical protein
MSNPQSDGNVPYPCTSTRKGHTTFFEHAVQRLTIHKFHNEVWSLRGFVDAHVVQRKDCRMGDLAEYPRFLKEAIARGATRYFGREELDGDDAANVGVMRAYDAAKGAGADSIENFVTADFHEHVLSARDDCKDEIRKSDGEKK